MAKGKVKSRSGSQIPNSLVALPKTIALNPDRQKPLFSFEFMQPSYDVESCTKDERAALAMKLYKLSQLTWEDIKKADRHGLGFEKISQDAIRAALPAVVLSKEIDLIAFRFCGKAPMVGIRRDRTFYIIWLDRKFTLYKH